MVYSLQNPFLVKRGGGILGLSHRMKTFTGDASYSQVLTHTVKCGNPGKIREDGNAAMDFYGQNHRTKTLVPKFFS